jgi:hypothetical protein
LEEYVTSIFKVERQAKQEPAGSRQKYALLGTEVMEVMFLQNFS